MKKVIKIIKVAIILVIIAIIGIIFMNSYVKEKDEIIPISSQSELEDIYNQKTVEDTIFYQILQLPFSILKVVEDDSFSSSDTNTSYKKQETQVSPGTVRIPNPSNYMGDSSSESSDASKLESTAKYSTTNIQVENVDEADITKTDGNYIYSLSEDEVIITDVRNPEQAKIVARITQEDANTFPEDLILYDNKLVIICERSKITRVEVFDISNRDKPTEIKNYEIGQSYYTSRCIEGKLYVIAEGKLKKVDNKVQTSYYEDEEKIDAGFSSFSRIKGLNTNSQTILSMLDLNDIKQPVKVNSYLMNIENAYVSENNIYLLDEKYKSPINQPKIIDMFGLKGVLGIFDDKDREVKEKNTGYYTDIYKFNLLEDGNIKFDKKTSEKGKTINQFSIDEYEKNLRIALYDEEGSRIVVWNEKMQKIGETKKLAEGEKMYSSRFLGDRAYLVTYKTIDPLFVIDLSEPTEPKVLGKLKIPGYSTYLHPYDENHIIGIGMQTEERINRDSNGRVISTSATITGMKMALFDITNVNKPIQISETIIGDSKTTSAILKNHKALLFSKEKQIIAIPVNNYEEDFEVNSTSDNYESMISSYNNYQKNYIAEGYFVYHINLTDGIKLKGTITHEKTKKTEEKYYNTYSKTKLLRGLYIDENLYTISEDYIKINRLEDLEEVNEIKIKEDYNGGKK